MFGTHRGSGVPAGVEALEADLRDESSMKAAFSDVASAAGRLDALVVSAGVAEQAVLPRLTRERIQAVLDVNTIGRCSPSASELR